MDLTSAPRPANFSYGEPLTAEQRRRTWPDSGPDVMLWRTMDKRREQFALLSTISYRAQVPGRGEVTVTVPGEFAHFTTDLTSVPSWFTWLVPKSGEHLPAALIHDGLVQEPGPPLTYVLDPAGEPIDRIDADVVFRDAMRDAHVGLIRRWIVWTGVTVWSLFRRPRRTWPTPHRWYFRALIIAQVLTIGYLGAAATLDLMDQDWRWFWNLPWMRGDLGSELLGGLAGAVLFSLLVTPLWGKYWRAGLIGALVVTTLVHVTVAVGVVALAYQAAEWAVRKAPAAALVVAIVVALGSVAVVVTTV